MAGLVPAIHVFNRKQDVDGRHKAGDEVGILVSTLFAPVDRMSIARDTNRVEVFRILQTCENLAASNYRTQIYQPFVVVVPSDLENAMVYGLGGNDVQDGTHVTMCAPQSGQGL